MASTVGERNVIILHWWNNDEGAKPKYREGREKKTVPVSLRPPEAASGLAWDGPGSLRSEAGAVAQLVETLRYKPEGRGF